MNGLRNMRIVLCLVLAASLTASAGAKPQAAQEAAGKVVEHLRLDGLGLEQALDRMRELGPARIVVDWPSLAAAGADRGSAVVMRPLSNVPFARALDAVLAGVAGRRAPLGWYIEGEVFIVTSQARILERRRVGAVMAELLGSPMPQAGASTAGTLSGRAAPAVQLVRRIDRLAFEDIALVDAVELFRAAAGEVNIFVNWRALEAVGLSRQTPVSLQAAGVSLAKVLDLVLDALNGGRDPYTSVHWVVEDGVVTISTGEELDRQMRVRMYDVTDLLIATPNFVGPSLSLNNAARTGDSPGGGRGYGDGLFDEDNARPGRGSGARDGEDDLSIAEQRAQVRDALTQVIRNTIGEEFWVPRGRGTITILRGRLIINQSLLGYKLMDRALRQ